jgi:hypothetical protein
MDRDSGIIDLFAIHKEEEERISAPSAAPSGPPPAVSFDTNLAMGEDADVDALAFAQAKSRKKVKIIGGALGGLAMVGILIAAIAGGGGATKEPATAAAAAPPPPPVATETLPAPAATPAPTQTSEPAPPATAKAEESKGGYTRAQAIAAYKNNAKKATKAAKSSGPKLQKVQSSGTN